MRIDPARAVTYFGAMNELPDRPSSSPPAQTPSKPTTHAPRHGGRVLVALYFIAYALAVTWPGMLLANRIEPLVLGLPFNLVWVAAWVVGGALVLGWFDHGERR